MPSTVNGVAKDGQLVYSSSPTYSVSSPCSSSISSNSSRRKPPPAHRLSCIVPNSEQESDFEVYTRPPRQKRVDKNQISTNKPSIATAIPVSAADPKAVSYTHLTLPTICSV